MLRKLVDHDHLPDYQVRFEGEKVVFRNRHVARHKKEPFDREQFPVLDPETYHDARTVAPGYDVYYLEQEWQAFWADSGKPELKNPDAAFIAFCRRRYERNPNP
jgi:hypothetical protein